MPTRARGYSMCPAGTFLGASARWVDFRVKSGFSDGSKLVVGGGDGQLRIFDFAELRAGLDEQQALLRSIAAHESWILEVVVSPEGSMAYSRAWDDPGKLWDLATGDSRRLRRNPIPNISVPPPFIPPSHGYM